MNKSADGIGTYDANQPQDEQDKCNGIEHVFFLFRLRFRHRPMPMPTGDCQSPQCRAWCLLLFSDDASCLLPADLSVRCHTYWFYFANSGTWKDEWLFAFFSRLIQGWPDRFL